MTEHELIYQAISGSMPDLEAVRNRCIDQGEGRSADKTKNGRAKRFISAAACAAVILAAACAIPYMHSILKTNDLYESGEGISAVTPPQTTARQSKPAAAPLIAVNELTKLPPAGKMNITLMKDDFVGMSRQELCDFYGVNVFPSVIPKDMSEMQNSAYGVYRRDHGAGELYFSQNELSYANSSAARTLNIEISKGRLPYTDIAAFENGKEVKSTINGNRLSVAHYCADKNDYYYADFLYHDVGFRIVSDNLSKAEFVGLLSSVLK